MSEHQKTTQVVLSDQEELKEHQTIEKLAMFVEVEPGVYANMMTAQSSALEILVNGLNAGLNALDERITALEEA